MAVARKKTVRKSAKRPARKPAKRAAAKKTGCKCGGLKVRSPKCCPKARKATAKRVARARKAR